MSHLAIYRAVQRVAAERLPVPGPLQYFDIGVGQGELVRSLRQQYPLQVSACK